MNKKLLISSFLTIATFAFVLPAWGHSPEHRRVKKELLELRQGQDVYSLPEYLSRDFNEVCDEALKAGKGLIVSIGREECGRCQIFYEFLKKGRVKIDPKKFVYVKLCIDDYEHKQYFFSTFEPPNNHLPFVGVIQGERSFCEPCLSGAQTPESYQKLMTGKPVSGH